MYSQYIFFLICALTNIFKCTGIMTGGSDRYNNDKLLENLEKVLTVVTNIEAKQDEFRTKLFTDLEKIRSRFQAQEVRLNNLMKCVKPERRVTVKTYLPENCQQVLNTGKNVTAIYTIQPKNGTQNFNVCCNMDTREGGWTYILNRFDGSQDFFLNWEDYKNGFGNLDGEFWLGLQHVYELAGYEYNELLVELVDVHNQTLYALYDKFTLGNESEGYAIKSLEGFNGNAGDSLTNHVNLTFVTQDTDADARICSETYHGAWWYHSCYTSQLTGLFFKNKEDEEYDILSGINWRSLSSDHFPLREARMMIRPHKNLH